MQAEEHGQRLNQKRPGTNFSQRASRRNTARSHSETTYPASPTSSASWLYGPRMSLQLSESPWPPLQWGRWLIRESGGSLSFQIPDPWLLTLRPVSRKWQCFCKRSKFNITSSDHVPFLLRTFQMLPFLLTENLKTSPVLKALLTPSDPISSLTVRPSTLPFADTAPITPAPMLCLGHTRWLPASGHLHMPLAVSRSLWLHIHVALSHNSNTTFSLSLPS